MSLKALGSQQGRLFEIPAFESYDLSLNQFLSITTCRRECSPQEVGPCPGLPALKGLRLSPLCLEFLPVGENSVWQALSLHGTLASPPPSQFRPGFLQASRPQNSLKPQNSLNPGAAQASPKCIFLRERWARAQDWDEYPRKRQDVQEGSSWVGIQV